MSTFEIPESALTRCIACNNVVQPGDRVMHEVLGFERDRTQGGTNHIIARKRTGRVIGPCCSHRVQRGDPIGQGSLL